MIHRFQGEAGKRLLVEAFRRQHIIRNDVDLATALAEVCSLMEFNAGDLIITQGEADNCIYFIVTGKVAVCIHGRIVAFRSTGDHIGDMAVIDPTARRSATIRAVDQTVVAGIEEFEFARLAEESPILWRRLAIELGTRLRERSKHVRPQNDIPKLFIGSSVEALSVAREIQSGLEHDPMEVIVWTDGVFQASKATIEDLATCVEQSDFAVLVLSADDTVIARGEETSAPRDNVIFELGLFMGALGRLRTYAVRPRGVEIKVPTDLFGITPLYYKPGNESSLPSRIAPVCTALRKLVDQYGPR
jgi:CRP/FNR family transcriptional regulator, cyclic AMP receptor protein